MIMRYQTVYSLMLMAWVFITSVTLKHAFIIKAASLLAVPSMVIQMLIICYSNISESQLKPDFEHKEIFGFQEYEFKRIEYLLHIIFIGLVCFYIKTVIVRMERSKKKKEDEMKRAEAEGSKENFIIMDNSLSVDMGIFGKRAVGHLPFRQILLAIFYKYSDIFSLFILFWIGLYTVNVIHFVLVLFFVVFLEKSSSQFGRKSRDPNVVDLSPPVGFVQKYWILLLIYIQLIIFLR